MLAWLSGDDALSKQHGVLFVAKVRKSCARSAEEQLIRNTRKRRSCFPNGRGRHRCEGIRGEVISRPPTLRKFYLRRFLTVTLSAFLI